MSNFLEAAKWTPRDPLPHQAAAWNEAWECLTKEEQERFLVDFRADPEPKETPPANLYQVVEPVLALIRKYESAGSGGYCAVNRGSSGDTPGGWLGLTEMSLAEVVEAQKQKKVFAVGAYQITPATMGEVLERAGLPMSMKFSPECQDWLAVVLVLGGWKRPKLTAYLLSQAPSVNAAIDDLAYEWASLPGANGRGMYDGDSAGNRAHGSVIEVRDALMECRRRIAGRRLTQLALVPPAEAAAPTPKPPAAPPPPRFATIAQLEGEEEKGLRGPKISWILKEGEAVILVNDKIEKARAYDCYGNRLWTIDAICQGQNSDYRVRGGDTPPGAYEAGQLYADYEAKAKGSPLSRDELAFGWYSIDMVELENQERGHGRSGIMMHGGGTALGSAAWNARQRLLPTLGCIRAHNGDLRDLVVPLLRKSKKLYILVYQN